MLFSLVLILLVLLRGKGNKGTLETLYEIKLSEKLWNQTKTEPLNIKKIFIRNGSFLL